MNALAMFQAMMNTVFDDHLRRFIIVFFDDILVFSKLAKEHVTHLTKAINLKRSKCAFKQSQIQLLGHMVAGDGVPPDANKVDAMSC